MEFRAVEFLTVKVIDALLSLRLSLLTESNSSDSKESSLIAWSVPPKIAARASFLFTLRVVYFVNEDCFLVGDARDGEVWPFLFLGSGGGGSSDA